MVHDLLINKQMFSTMVNVHHQKAIRDDSTFNTFSTPLENAQSFRRIKHEQATPEQIDKFIDLFDKNTTWKDVFNMAGENAKQTEEAYRNKEITPEEFEENRGWKR